MAVMSEYSCTSLVLHENGDHLWQFNISKLAKNKTHKSTRSLTKRDGLLKYC